MIYWSLVRAPKYIKQQVFDSFQSYVSQEQRAFERKADPVIEDANQDSDETDIEFEMERARFYGPTDEKSSKLFSQLNKIDEPADDQELDCPEPDADDERYQNKCHCLFRQCYLIQGDSDWLHEYFDCAFSQRFFQYFNFPGTPGPVFFMQEGKVLQNQPLYLRDPGKQASLDLFFDDIEMLRQQLGPKVR